MSNKKRFSIITALFLVACMFFSALFFPMDIKAGEADSQTVTPLSSEVDLLPYVEVTSDGIKNGQWVVNVGLALDVNKNGIVDYEGSSGINEINYTRGQHFVEKLFTKATLSIRTRDASAIASMGDYVDIDREITLSLDSAATVLIDVNTMDFGAWGAERTFFFEVYNVEIVGLKEGLVKVEPHRTKSSSVSLYVDNDINVSISDATFESGENEYKLKVYDDVGTYYYSIGSGDIIGENNIVQWTIDLKNAPAGWYKKIKYMADNGMIKLGYELDGKAKQEEDTFWYIDNSLVVVTHEAVGTSTKHLSTWHIKFQNDATEYLGIKNHFETSGSNTFEGQTAKSSFGSGVTYQDHISPQPNYVVIDDIESAFGENTSIRVTLSSIELDEDKRILDGCSSNLLAINEYAKVVSTSVGKLRIDENGNPKIGLSMRFSEPVQIKNYTNKTNNKPIVETYVNGASQNVLPFEYVSGNGSDTFYFEANASEINTNITSLKLKGVENFETVYDIAPNTTGQTALPLLGAGGALYGYDDIEHVMTCSFDFRTPRVYTYRNPPTTPAKSHNVTVCTENVSTAGTLRYAWTSINPEISPYVGQMIETSVSEQGFQTINSPTGVSGEMWLYVDVVSKLGKSAEQMVCAGPYYFDNDAPIISVNCINDEYKTKTFELAIDNNVSTITKKANLKSVYAVVTSDEEGENLVAEIPLKLTGLNLSNDDFTFNLEITAEALGVGVDGAVEYGDYYIHFVAVDDLENVYETQTKSYYYDTREVFDVTFSTQTPISVTVDKNLGNDHYSTVLTRPTESGVYDKVTFTSMNESVNIAVKNFIRVSDGKVMAKGVDFDENLSGNVDEIILYNTLQAGLYEIVFKDTSEGSMQESFAQYLYTTEGKDIGKTEGEFKGENTTIYDITQKSSVLTNRVYQLPEGTQYCYASISGAINKEYYGGTSLMASFSSYLEAYEYVYFHELLDLYAITLTSEMASDLNQNIYKKADGVNVTAEEGQVWVRYKIANWRPSSTTTTWVYYYYSNGEGAPAINPPINEGAFSAELCNALDTVTINIVDMGIYQDLVLGNDLDKYGAPKLDQKQMHVGVESATQSKCGTPFSTAVYYDGDGELYYSQSVDTPLSTNVVISATEHTTLYYKNSSIAQYVKIECAKDTTFGEYFNASGTYQILEYDVYGVREYSIYVDVDAPKISFTWVTQNGTTQKKLFTENDNNQVISGTNFYLEGVDDSEYDPLAFVAIYEYRAQGVGTLLAVFRKTDFAYGLGVSMPDGVYYIHVSDRSGNDYLFTLRVKSEELICKIKEVENTSIEISFNRDESEVSYQVFLDGYLLTTNYNERKFDKAGYYQFYIEDVYGNVYDEYFYAYEYKKDDAGNYLVDENGAKIPVLDENGNKIPINDEEGFPLEAYYLFERDLPVASWRYQNADGAFVPYEDGVTVEMEVLKTGERSYSISTSATLQFSLPSGCNYEVLSGTPNVAKVGLSQWFVINNLSPFTIMVYYEKHLDSYVIYSCTVDLTAPAISVYYQENSYSLAEYDEMRSKFESGEFVAGDNPFTPSFIGFSSKSEKTVYVEDGGVAYNSFYRIKVSDTNGIKQIEVYLDGKLIISQTSDFNKILLSRYGNYEIKATDNFGNEKTFTFSNNKYSYIEYKVDGQVIETPEDASIFFDYENNSFTKIDFGKESSQVVFLSNAKSYYLITDEHGTQYYFAFELIDGVVKPLSYVVTIDQTENEINVVEGDTLVNLRGADIIANKEYEIASINSLGVSIYASIDSSKAVTFTVKSNDAEYKKYTVETRVITKNDVLPYYVKSEISSYPSTVKFLDVSGNENEVKSLNVKLNKAFKVALDDQTITSVKVAFFASGNYQNYVVVYDGEYYNQTFENEGMYHVEVINKYGVITNYNVVLSSKFLITTKINYADETFIEYSSPYTFSESNPIFYSNGSVEFIVYTPSVMVSIDNGAEILYEQNAQGYIEILIDKIGVSKVRIFDEYGNELVKEIRISSSTNISDDFLYGFNEDALRRDENYTNQKISIREDKVIEKSIAYIAIRYGDKLEIIYDEIGEDKVEFYSYMLKNCIGQFGDGEYKVILRDLYGNKHEERVYYRENSTLTIERVTLNSLKPEIYTIENMLANGVWTNNSVRFVVSAIEYQLKVDGFENVTVISFENKTKNEYNVSYLDEYGFKYEFKVHLNREEVSIAPSDQTNVVAIHDELVTKDDLSMVFTEGATCTYVYNSTEMGDYVEGQKLYKDGIYHFKVVDLAGNTTTYVIRKDSVVEFRMDGAGVSERLINGSVTNGAQVNFYPLNSDSAYIKKVFHNNRLIEYDETKFTDRGKWELIIADEIGNETYFRFYILRGKLDGFTYNAPYDYLITSVVWESGGTSAIAGETIKNLGKTLEATENGNYEVVLTSTITGEELTFNFTIDKTPPNVYLDGCAENEKTINNVKIKGYSLGDTIYIYKDGKLIDTLVVDSSTFDEPVINEGGKYKIIVENEAGITSELNFERKFIPNVAGSVLIIIVILALASALLVGLIWRNHSKTDD